MRFKALDGWRGVCALAVATFHLPVISHITDLGVIRNAWLFVDFFFVLSGFILSHVYSPLLKDMKEVSLFMLRRFGRLWPLHIVMLGIFICLEIGKLLAWRNGVHGDEVPFTASHAVGAIATNLFLVQAMGFHSVPTWNGASWSISTEIWVSFLFALVVFWARARLMSLSAVLAALSCLVVAMCSPDYMQADGTWAFFRCTFGFFVGVLAYGLVRKPTVAQLLAARVATVAECCAVLAVVGFMTMVPSGPETLGGPLVFAAAVVIFSEEKGSISRFLKYESLRRLGELSFSIYMVNELISTTMSRGLKAIGSLSGQPLPVAHYAAGQAFLLHDRFTGDFTVVAACAMILVVADLAWRFIEVPGRKYVYLKANYLEGRSESYSRKASLAP